MRTVGMVLVALISAGTLARGQGQAPFPSVLVFVDDLHIAFRSTPQLRADLQETVTRLVAVGRSVAVLTDASPSVLLQPTTDPGRLAQAVNRITGSGLKAASARETTRRAAMAHDTLRQTIDRLQPSTVIYVTEEDVQPSGLWMPVFVTPPNALNATVTRVTMPLLIASASGSISGVVTVARPVTPRTP